MDPIHEIILKDPVEPYPPELMKGGRGICALIFEAFNLIENEEARMKLQLATTLTKRMHKRFLETLVKLGDQHAEKYAKRK